MSLEISPTTFEIRSSVDGSLILNQDAKLIPSVAKITASNVNVAFPNLSKTIATIRREGFYNTSSQSPNNRSWKSYAWGMNIARATQSGQVVLGTAPAGTAPNFILARMTCVRTANPNESIWGPFVKGVPEGVWMPVRSGVRLEYNAFMRRIAWLEIQGRNLVLRWKQSTLAYFPNYLDSAEIRWPRLNYTLKVPPSYQLGFSYRESGSGDFFPPSDIPPTAAVNNALAAVNFASTWRFNVVAEMCQL